MSKRHVAAAALAVAAFSLVACKPASDEAGGWDPAKSQLTERRLETLTDVARALRDANGGHPASEADVTAAVRAKHPGTGADDPFVDGYGRAIRYEVVADEQTGSSLLNGFRFISQGADPDNPADDLKREAIVEHKPSGG